MRASLARQRRKLREASPSTPRRLRQGRPFSGFNPGFLLNLALDGERVDRIKAPQVLDFDAHRDVTVVWIGELQHALFDWDGATLDVDLSGLETISPPAAVVLGAEIYRCLAYTADRGSRKRVRTMPPSPNSQAHEMLLGLGVFSYLGARLPPWYAAVPERKRWWFSVRHCRRTQTRGIDALLRLYEDNLDIDAVWRRDFYESIVEVANNVPQHAYDEAPGRRPWIKNLWWLAGAVDQDRQTIDFVIWDQGVGIPHHMRGKMHIPLLSKNDAELIEQATREGETRTRSRERRGRGLPVLLSMINAAESGSLVLSSGRGSVVCNPGSPVEKFCYTSELGGTLVWWTMGTAQLSKPRTP